MSLLKIINIVVISLFLQISSAYKVSDEWSSDEQSRIIGGLVAVDGLFPFQVSLQSSSECSQHGHICGATLVGPRHLLTAASCVTDKLGDSTWTAARVRQFRAHVTSTDLDNDDSIAFVQLITVHPEYDPDTHLHDLAVLQITMDASTVGLPLQLANPGDTTTSCNVTGWGISAASDDSYSSALRWGEVNTKGGTQCSGVAFQVTSDMLCAGDSSVDLCAGDRGAALVCGGVLRGVATHSGCGGGSIFTDILSADHRSFVQDFIKSRATYNSIATIPLAIVAVLVILCNFFH